MSRKIPSVSSSSKKEIAEKLIERYIAKKELLAEWDENPDLDREYRNQLKEKVDMYKRDLMYRGIL